MAYTPAMQDDCMDAGGTTPWMEEVEPRLEQRPRATQGAVAEQFPRGHGCQRLPPPAELRPRGSPGTVSSAGTSWAATGIGEFRAAPHWIDPTGKAALERER